MKQEGTYYDGKDWFNDELEPSVSARACRALFLFTQSLDQINETVDREELRAKLQLIMRFANDVLADYYGPCTEYGLMDRAREAKKITLDTSVLKSLEWRRCMYGCVDFKDCQHFQDHIKRKTEEEFLVSLTSI